MPRGRSRRVPRRWGFSGRAEAGLLKKYWVDEGYEDRSTVEKRKPFITDPAAFVKGLLKGGAVSAVYPGKLLHPDPVPAKASVGSESQLGVTVEYRHMTERPDPNNLETSLMRIVREVRELNTQSTSQRSNETRSSRRPTSRLRAKTSQIYDSRSKGYIYDTVRR